MKPEQAVVVDWMKRTMRFRGWTAENWATRAGVAPTTVTRSMRDSYDGVSSLAVLHRLARAAEVDSPLDALRVDRVLVEMPYDAELLDAVDPKLRDALREALLRRVEQIVTGPDSP